MLEEESELNTHGMQVAEEKIDPVVKRYFHLQDLDPEFVEDYFKSQALEYMVNWTELKDNGPKSLAEYWHELWMTREEFEKEIAAEMKGYHLVSMNYRDAYERKLLHNRLRSEFHIEALERALAETKMNSMRQINLLEMTLCDIESRANSAVISFNEVEEVLNNPPKIAKLGDAQKRIARLENVLRSQQKLVAVKNAECTHLKAELEKSHKREAEMADRVKILIEYKTLFVAQMQALDDDALRILFQLDSLTF
jgi:hypothetical protein